MALVLEDINLVRQRSREDAQKVGIAEALRALWKHMVSLRNPDLKIKFFSGLETADVVISDAACKLFFVAVTKPSGSTTDAWFKISDHASVAAAAADVVAKLIGTGGGGRAYGVTFLDGLKLGTGATAGCHTTNNGATKSAAADAATGFAIVGAA